MAKLSIEFITKRTIYYDTSAEQCDNAARRPPRAPCASDIKAAGNPVFHVRRTLFRSPTQYELIYQERNDPSAS